MLSLGLVALALPLAARAQWTHDGGSPVRNNAFSVNFPILSAPPQPHIPLVFGEPEEDTVSEVEEQLLQSPLVVSTGELIVVMTDSCNLVLMSDPSPPVSGSWPSPVAVWNPATDPGASATVVDECDAAGMALSTTDTVFFLDGRNKAVHAVAIDVETQTFSWQWSSALDTAAYAKSILPLDASLLVLGSQLWVPLKWSLKGTDGVSWVLDVATGNTTQVAGLPGAPCRENEDLGNAIVTLEAQQQGVAQLSSSDCGLPLYSAVDFSLQAEGPIPDDFASAPFGFEMGQHTHPVVAGDRLFYFQMQDNIFSGPQRVCCWDTVRNAPCRGWEDLDTILSGCASPLPVLNTGVFDQDNATETFRFSWIAGGLFAAQNQLLVATSGVLNEDVFARAGWASTLSLIDGGSGAVLASYRTGTDIYNSAPLVVTGTDGTIVLLTTAAGDLLAFAATEAGVAAGPMWRSSDLPGIPAEDLPASTYAFLSITPAGTLLATVSAGGAEWQKEKAFVSALGRGGVGGMLGARAVTRPHVRARAKAHAQHSTRGHTHTHTRQHASSPPLWQVAIQNGLFAPQGGGVTVTATATASATASAAPPAVATGTATASASSSATATATASHRGFSPLPVVSSSPSTAPPPGAGGNSAAASGLSPAAAAGVSLVVIAALVAGGLYAFVTYFGGGPTLNALWASLAGQQGPSVVARAGGATGEKTSLLSQQAAQSRFAAQ